jgi:hypothetical protein
MIFGLGRLAGALKAATTHRFKLMLMHNRDLQAQKRLPKIERLY